MESWNSTWSGSRGGETTLVVDGDLLADGHFLIIQEVVAAVRRGASVIILGSGPSQGQYESVAKKLGVDLTRHGIFTYCTLIPPLSGACEDGTRSLMVKEVERGGSRVLSIEGSSETGASGGAGGSPDGTEHLKYVLLELEAKLLSSPSEQEVLLVLDDLSVVEGIYRPHDCMLLIQSCRALVGRHPQLAMLVRAQQHQAAIAEDDVSVPLLPYLLRTADNLLEVRPLSSGYSRDVHGLVAIRPHPSLATSCAPEVLTFKVYEGGAKFDRLGPASTARRT